MNDIRNYLIWPIPNCPNYFANADGDVMRGGKKLKPYFKNNKKRKRMVLCLYVRGKRKRVSVARLVLSAKLGRPLLRLEDACHINGNPLDNRMRNLRAADRVNNIIDEIELGRLSTTPFYVDMAIRRLEDFKKNQIC